MQTMANVRQEREAVRERLADMQRKIAMNQRVLVQRRQQEQTIGETMRAIEEIRANLQAERDKNRDTI